MMIAYFGYEAVIMNVGFGVIAGIPGNIGQGICGIIISGVLIPALSKTRAVRRFGEEI